MTATGPSLMTPQERRDLARMAHLRARLARDMVAARQAELVADFEAQLAAVYWFDQDSIWKEAYAAAATVVKEANAKVAARCEELGIPGEFAPSISAPYWYGRGSNEIAERRTELRKVAVSRIAANAKQAIARIESSSLRIQSDLLSDGLTSDAARAFLDTMPTAEALMPALLLADVQAEPKRLALPDDALEDEP